MVRVCVDAMGGDDAVELVLEGVAQAVEADANVEVLLVGDAQVVEPFCESHERVYPLVSTQVIGMDEHPAEAVRHKKDSSIVRGCTAVKEGEAQAFFSAGSTGAILAAATLIVGRVKGVKRPALAAPLTGLTGRQTLMMDLGANADCRPEMLLQFAEAGASYARVMFGVEEPRVALLSNGEEDTKGNEATLAAHELLRQECSCFAGNCEGGDILAGTYDVVVCDGFTGNVALKTMEGTAKYILKLLMGGAAKLDGGSEALSALKPAIAQITQNLSGDAYGGAVLVGLSAPVFIGHGSTSAEAVKNGVLSCADAVRGNLIGRISA